jgi:hypothetical protein
MGLRAIGLIAALGGAVAVGWTAGGYFQVEPEVAYTTASVSAPDDAKSDRAPVRPIAAAAIVDRPLFDPQPMLPVHPPMQVVALAEPSGSPEPELTRAAPPMPAPAPEVRRLVVPKLDKNTGLTPAHIAQIRQNLRLTPEQEQHWGPIEAELRELAKQMAAQKQQGRKPTLTADAAQRLYWAAGPFIMSLRDDQKQEARRLARAMGLEQVAALL